MYQPSRISRTEFVPVRSLRYHVRLWGQPGDGRPPLVMVHGWMDISASWQFVVDAMAQDRFIIAPDWRGFGLTEVPGADNFWFPDYLADLDFLLDRYAGEGPVDLVGHSMGGNVSMMYAGVRPQRLRRLVNLEGFGMPGARASQAPGRYAAWIDQLHQLQRGEMDLVDYDNLEGVAGRLIKTNPRLDAGKAHWLARHWARQGASGRWRIQGDPAHKIISAHLYREEETLALYERITAPTLFVQAEEDSPARWWKKGEFTRAQFHERFKRVQDGRHVELPACGHMLHHDQPEAVAGLIENFLAD